MTLLCGWGVVATDYTANQKTNEKGGPWGTGGKGERSITGKRGGSLQERIIELRTWAGVTSQRLTKN